MRTLLSACILSLTGLPVFSLEATIKCEPISWIEWQLEKTDYGPAGFQQKSIEDEKPSRLSLEKGIRSIVYDTGFPEIWKFEAVDTHDRSLVGKKPRVWSVRYRPLEDDVEFLSRLILKDPMCEDGPKSTLVHSFTGIDSVSHVIEKCECLNEYDVDRFITA